MPPSIESPDFKQVISMEGEEAILPCVTAGEPRPDVSWRKNGLDIDFYSLANDHSYLLEPSGSLYVPQVTVADAGRFMCVVENAAGFVTKELELVVYGKASMCTLRYT